MRSRGFTLIEMLVVVAIVAILMALLMPTLRKGLDAAKSAACTNNEKQLFVSFNMFADDHKGYYPPGNTKYTGTKDVIDWPFFSTSNEATWDGRWINCLGPYFGKNDWVYKKSNWGFETDGTPAWCPAAIKPDISDRMNYGLNVNLGKHAYRDNNYTRCCSKMTKVSQIPHPGISVMLIDTQRTATSGPGKPAFENYLRMEAERNEASYSGMQVRRHMDGGNVLFADGRIKWFVWQYLEGHFTNCNDATYGGLRLP